MAPTLTTSKSTPPGLAGGTRSVSEGLGGGAGSGPVLEFYLTEFLNSLIISSEKLPYLVATI